MKSVAMIRSFNNRYPFVGPIVWMTSVQYFVVQLIVAAAWTSNYSLAANTISDLGNTACGLYAGRIICSPLHSLMNASFITLGATMAIGSALIYHGFMRTKSSAIGFSLMAIAALGTIIVGLAPENSVGTFHQFGAALAFLVGNLGITILGFVLELPKTLRQYSILSGFLALIALALFKSGIFLGLGVGGMERLTAYPQTLWLIVFGVYISSNHIRAGNFIRARRAA